MQIPTDIGGHVSEDRHHHVPALRADVVHGEVGDHRVHVDTSVESQTKGLRDSGLRQVDAMHFTS